METNEDDESSSNQTTMIQAILHKGEDERDLPRNVTHLVVHHSFDWPDSCFLSNLERLVTVTLQSGVKKIAANSFACCMSLREVSIPSTVEIIEHSAFSCCVSLALVNLHHEGLQCIGDEAFMNCDSCVRSRFRLRPIELEKELLGDARVFWESSLQRSQP
mmetsp:Transcript_9911/g.23452  ORF Transcript_9911/g.23452 Transcript_9911/m.23452 type:complete len:161 (+) Transcript_9911:66-548(+)